MHKKNIYIYIYIFIFTYITYTLTHLLVPYIITLYRAIKILCFVLF